MQRVYRTHRRAMVRLRDTQGATTPLQRLLATRRGMTAGNCIYGLFRADVLARAGVFRPVLAPDRQILLQCLLLGGSIHVPEMLWFREVAGMFSYRRQRSMFFPTGNPWHTYLPATLQHAAVVFWDFGIRGRARPAFGRTAGAAYALAMFCLETWRELTRRDAGWRRALALLRPSGGDRAAGDDDRLDATTVAERGQ
jgi:hypothetical protein